MYQVQEEAHTLFEGKPVIHHFYSPVFVYLKWEMKHMHFEVEFVIRPEQARCWAQLARFLEKMNYLLYMLTEGKLVIHLC